VRLVNLAHRQVQLRTGRTTLATLRSVLVRLRRYYRHPLVVTGVSSVDGDPVTTTQIDVAAPLHVTGVISPRVSVDELLGAGRPLERAFVLPGAVTPSLKLRVALLPPLEIQPAELADARHLLTTLQVALGNVQISDAYQRYLASPAEPGASEASYVYRSVSEQGGGRRARAARRQRCARDRARGHAGRGRPRRARGLVGEALAGTMARDVLPNASRALSQSVAAPRGIEIPLAWATSRSTGRRARRRACAASVPR
jgi:hypothetical protein